MLLTIMIACSVGGTGPATQGSPAAEELAAVARIQEQAEDIESLSGQLEGLTDHARATEDGPERTAIIAQMRTVMAQITEKNTTLQADVEALEDRLHAAAGDPVHPTTAED